MNTMRTAIIAGLLALTALAAVPNATAQVPTYTLNQCLQDIGPEQAGKSCSGTDPGVADRIADEVEECLMDERFDEELYEAPECGF